jgi:hypothetical protein
LFEDNNNKINIPEGITEEELEAQRYAHKMKMAYKDKYLYQQKADDMVVTLFNVIPYQIKEEGPGIGDGFIYYIIDIGLENKSNTTFNTETFTKSCHLTTTDSTYRFSNFSSVLKMYSIQTDSSELDDSNNQNFYKDNMPPKEFYRAKLLAYEVSLEEKDALYFQFMIGNKNYRFKIRDTQQ